MTAKDLKDKYEKDLKDLQESCTHEKATQMEYHWAPGHFSGTMVEVCDRCWKTIKTLPPKINTTVCMICNELGTEEEIANHKCRGHKQVPNSNILFPKEDRGTLDNEQRFC